MSGDMKIYGQLVRNVTFYEKWAKAEGIPIYEGFGVESLSALELGTWERMGGNGCFLHLKGGEESTNSYVCEIEPAKNLKPEKHMYEELVLIVQGTGATSIWQEGGPPQTFEWQEGSLFAIPLNAWHQHFNGRSAKPARFVGTTNAPITMNLYHNLDYIFNNNFIFRDRFSGEQGYFNGSGKFYDIEGLTVKCWETNFIPDVSRFETYELKERGGSGSSVIFEMANGTMASHISEFGVGCYKKAHRHGPGANIIMLRGEGYSLMWQGEEEKVVIPWHAGSLFVPPGGWFHQHFNTGKEPARYVALKYSGGHKNPLNKAWRSLENVKKGGDQIEYEDEAPEIGAMYRRELAKKGVELRMKLS